jgi:alkanesulfonate monooxygenase SsuD/methylene tetrahydromethanopterin reductase-like flavin-dependent oxidoreductase (luciferase family)
VKVGVLQFSSWPERRVALETVYARALERIDVMDRSGYDAVWLAEHHFSGFTSWRSMTNATSNRKTTTSPTSTSRRE